ncbi:MAG: SCO family protein [Pseudomonadota bacterium]
MRHNARHHLVGLASLCAAAGFLVGLPLVAADTRASVRAPFQDQLVLAPAARTMLMFAGFPGCQGVCPTALKQLAAVQDLANRELGDGQLAVVFVNLHLDTGDAGAAAYARSFHPDFYGLTATSSDRAEINSLLAQTGSRNLAELGRHRGNVYHYHRTATGWTLARVYPSLPSRASLISDVRETLAAALE